MFNYYNNK